jgi:peptidoglycan/LPS O-acetylase OafA/YrhL
MRVSRGVREWPRHERNSIAYWPSWARRRICSVYHFLSSTTPTSPPSRFLAHGFLAVDLFFCLSGFVMALVYGHLFAQERTFQTFVRFLGHRIARIYPMYFLATMAAATLISLGWLEYRSHRLPIDLALNLAMIQTWISGESLDAPAWSLSAEWAAYVLFPMLIPIALSRHRIRSILGLSIAVSSVIILYALLPRENLSGHAIPIVRCLSEFTLGLYVYRAYRSPVWLRWQSIVWLQPFAVGLYLILLACPNSESACVITGTFMILTLSTDSGFIADLLKSKVIYHLGILSYSLYLVHHLFPSLNAVIHRTANQHGLRHGQLIAAFVTIPLALLVSELAVKKIEIPGRRLLRRTFDRRLQENS